MARASGRQKAKRLTVISRKRAWDSEGFAQVLVQYVLCRLAEQEPDEQPPRADKEPA